jgi:hypothetical protein
MDYGLIGREMEKFQMMRDNIVYNKFDNEVMVKTNGDYIYIICQKEDQVQPVMDRMNTDTCFLSEYEEWDEQPSMWNDKK